MSRGMTYTYAVSIDSDPLFASIRRKPEFGEVRSAAISCQKKFLAERGQ